MSEHVLENRLSLPRPASFPRTRRFVNRFVEIYAYREVLSNIVSQHLKVKYKRTYFGYLWSLFNPILQLAVLSLVFSQMVRLQVDNYVLYLFSGLVVWNYFSNCVQQGSGAILEAEHFIKKVYLPKLMFPLARILLSTIDFISSLFALTLLGVLLGMPFHWTILAVPLAFLPLFCFCFGVLLLVSVGTVFFRDIQYLATVVLQLLYFLTPIIYPLSMVPEKHQKILRLNPLLYEVVPFQKLIYSGQLPTAAEWGVAWLVGLAFLFIGLITLFSVEDEIIFRM